MNDTDKSKQIATLLDNNFLIPIRGAKEHIRQLGTLFRAIARLTDKHDDIKKLADLGDYIAMDISDWLEGAHETAETEHVPTIISALS